METHPRKVLATEISAAYVHPLSRRQRPSTSISPTNRPELAGPELNVAAQRHFNVHFSFPVVHDDADGRCPRLGRADWAPGEDGFCSTCAWCHLMQDGTRRTLECGTLAGLLRAADDSGVYSGRTEERLHVDVNIRSLNYRLQPP
jgi:hypothetical protein